MTCAMKQLLCLTDVCMLYNTNDVLAILCVWRADLCLVIGADCICDGQANPGAVWFQYGA